MVTGARQGEVLDAAGDHRQAMAVGGDEAQLPVRRRLDVDAVEVHPGLVAGDREQRVLDHLRQRVAADPDARRVGRRIRHRRELARVETDDAEARLAGRHLDPVVVLLPDAHLALGDLAHHLVELARPDGDRALLLHRRGALPAHGDLLIGRRHQDAVAGRLDEHVPQDGDRRPAFDDALRQVEACEELTALNGEFHGSPPVRSAHFFFLMI